MTGTLNLIVSEEPVNRSMLARMKISKPNIAVIYADAFGQLHYFGGQPLSRTQQMWSAYRTRYEVDISDHRRTAQLDSWPLPSRGDSYFFRSGVDVGFRVTSPEKVVRRHVTDALSVVYNYLIDAFRPVTRGYEIDDAAGAEVALNRLFLGSVELDEGITIYHCRTRLQPDAAAQDYLRSLTAAKRTLDVGQAEHQVTRATARQEQEIAEITQVARLTAERRELEAMAGQPMDLHGLIRAHLAKHPEQTAYALELLARHEQAQLARRDLNDERSLDLARYMMEQGLIQAVDVEVLRSNTITRVQQIASPAGLAELTSASWDDPLPGDPAPVLSLPAPAEPAPPRAALASAIPVYVIVDVSPADAGYLEALNNAIQTLPRDLARYPEVISAIRLAVLGYSGEVQVRMPLTAVAADSFVPVLTPGGGADLAATLTSLRDLIADDVTRLKSRGMTVGRPTVYLLSAASARDESAWDAALRQLADRGTFAYAPNILAFGIGAAPPEVIVRIAELPGSRGWISLPGTPLSEAAGSFAAFARTSIVSIGRAHVTGRDDAGMASPERFRPVGDRA